MDPELLKTMAYVIGGGIVFFLLARFSARPKKCAMCSNVTTSTYRDANDKSAYMCKNHLIQRWKKDVAVSAFDMIMIEPDFKNYPHAYVYATVEKLKEWQYQKPAQYNISSILDATKGRTCKECNKAASVAYFRKEEYEVPFLEKVLVVPTYLCKNCAVEKIEPSLRNAQKDFIEGVYAPAGGRGIYHVQEF